jgi:hypothetical protein
MKMKQGHGQEHEHGHGQNTDTDKDLDKDLDRDPDRDRETNRDTIPSTGFDVRIRSHVVIVSHLSALRNQTPVTPQHRRADVR